MKINKTEEKKIRKNSKHFSQYKLHRLLKLFKYCCVHAACKRSLSKKKLNKQCEKSEVSYYWTRKKAIPKKFVSMHTRLGESKCLSKCIHAQTYNTKLQYLDSF